jgi:hypothetical protein
MTVATLRMLRQTESYSVNGKLEIADVRNNKKNNRSRGRDRDDT